MWWQQRYPDSEELTEFKWWHLGDIRDQMSRHSAKSSIPIKSRYLILILAQHSSINNRGFWLLFWSNYCSHGFSRLSSFKSGNGFLFYKENIPPFKWIYKGREGVQGRTKKELSPRKCAGKKELNKGAQQDSFFQLSIPPPLLLQSK